MARRMPGWGLPGGGLFAGGGSGGLADRLRLGPGLGFGIDGGVGFGGDARFGGGGGLTRAGQRQRQKKTGGKQCDFRQMSLQSARSGGSAAACQKSGLIHDDKMEQC